jgi:hypothetical protein
MLTFPWVLRDWFRARRTQETARITQEPKLLTYVILQSKTTR